MEQNSGALLEADSVLDDDSQLGENTYLGEDEEIPIEKESGGTASHSYLVFKTSKLTEASLELGLHGPVPSTTYRSKLRLATSFGFGSSAAFMNWIDSEAFKPYYSDLQARLQQYVSTEDIKNLRHKPRLMHVQKALVQGERYGIQRYSRRSGPDIESFSAIDFYALFLFYVVEYNSLYAEGAFFGKKMTIEDMQARVWQAMLRANLENTTRRSREEQSTGEASSSVDSHSGEAGEVTEAAVPKEV